MEPLGARRIAATVIALLFGLAVEWASEDPEIQSYAASGCIYECFDWQAPSTKPRINGAMQ